MSDALRRSGNLLAIGLLLAHPYDDGNGRTARVLGLLIQNGYDPNDQESVNDLRVLSSNRDGSAGFVSYAPSGDWTGGKANQDPFGFLAAVAALDEDLSDDKEFVDPIVTPIKFTPH